MACQRHRKATDLNGHCPACLLEAALASPDPGPDGAAVEDAPAREYTIQLRIGAGTRSTVYLVREAGPVGRLLRLKAYSAPAHPDFLVRFQELRRALLAADVPGLDVPLRAFVGAGGRPIVLSTFYRGVLLTDALHAGTLHRAEARTALDLVRRTIAALHQKRLAHGSITGGNLIVLPRTASVQVLDPGLRLLHGGLPLDDTAAVEGDREQLAGLVKLAGCG